MRVIARALTLVACLQLQGRKTKAAEAAFRELGDRASALADTRIMPTRTRAALAAPDARGEHGPVVEDSGSGAGEVGGSALPRCWHCVTHPQLTSALCHGAAERLESSAERACQSALSRLVAHLRAQWWPADEDGDAAVPEAAAAPALGDVLASEEAAVDEVRCWRPPRARSGERVTLAPAAQRLGRVEAAEFRAAVLALAQRLAHEVQAANESIDLLADAKRLRLVVHACCRSFHDGSSRAH